jgi:predicted RNA methylase
MTTGFLLLLLLLLAAAAALAHDDDRETTVVHSSNIPKVRALLQQLEQGRGQRPQRQADGECLVTEPRFGAKCDGATNDTLSLQKALDSCGSVALPDGKTCLTHGLQLHNATQFRIPDNAVLKAFPNASAWDPKQLHLLVVSNLRDATLFGGGTLDGSGNTWWVTPNASRPHMFFNYNLHNTTFRDLKLINRCETVLLEVLIEPATKTRSVCQDRPGTKVRTIEHRA